MDLSELEILEIIGSPLHLPPYPCHTLDVERMVPVVTESALQRIGPVNRHRYLLKCKFELLENPQLSICFFHLHNNHYTQVDCADPEVS